VAIILRPLTIGELLDQTFFHYRRHFTLFVGIAALPSLLLLVFQLLPVFVKPIDPIATVLWSVGTLFVYWTTTTLAHGATVIAVSEVVLERSTSIAEAFQTIRPRLGTLILISLNVGLRVMIGFLLLIVPGILLTLRYALVIPAAVLEDLGVSDSLSRSAALTKGHRGRIFLVYFLLLVLVLIGTMTWPFLVTTAAAMVLRSAEAAQSAVWVQVLLHFGSFVTQSLMGPIMTIALTLVYYDERVRKEAFDLKHMMRQLDTAVLRTPRTA
jgi:uncharacterized membrane protein